MYTRHADLDLGVPYQIGLVLASLDIILRLVAENCESPSHDHANDKHATSRSFDMQWDTRSSLLHPSPS